MKVYLVGEVTTPGAYDISALSTVINALAAAGGPTKQGTLRSIQVLRGGHVVETVDLYDFFLKGNKSRDIRLQPGDTINVPVHGKLVGIAGNVRKPAIYEFKNESSLKALLAMAGGISPSSYLQRVQLSRVVANDKKIVADFSLDTKRSGKTLDEMTEALKLQDMDIVKVFPIDLKVHDHVQLDGYVLRPGGYALKRNMRVKDLLGADNMLPEYYPDTLEISRLVGEDFHTIKIYVNLEKALQGNEQDNILLQEFDAVRVFSRWEMQEFPRVTISGDVQRPGIYRVFPQMTVRDLIFAAGNLKPTAYLRSAEITRTVISKDAVKSTILNIDLDEALKGNAKDNLVLANFDEVIIRRVPNWHEETDRYFTLTGEVRFPGVYPLLKGERLSDLIKRAGGYTDRAYLNAAKFTRKLTRDIQQKRMDEVIVRSEQELARKQQELATSATSKDELDANKAAIEAMRTSLEKMKLAKAEGRISIHLTPLEQLKNSPYDLELQGGDALEIPQSSNSIMVLGEVYNPTTVVEVPDGTVDSYLKSAGGPTGNAKADEMYVVKADGTVVSRQERSGLFHDSFMSMNLTAGDAIVVPQRLEKTAFMRDLKDIAFIIGQAALAAGVIVAAGL
jgi:protein involved in polysaccharide export with SLBB domain